ncbi:complex I subunit 4 family protein [Actinospongicola halichondriae]|uniref:complex I subunit 4 family protein n=1 Tax=Actinospongicola halichondriae TaxID=3236844 RepID=UPI003D471FB4
MHAVTVFASAGPEVSFPLLTAAILVPLIGAIVVASIPKRRTEILRLVALLFSGTAGAFTLWMLAAFDRHDAGMQFESVHTWIEEFGIQWHLGVDGISLFLVVLTGVLFPLTFVAVTPKKDPKAYYAWLLLLEAGCIGAFTSLDLFLFFIFFEIVLVPMYFLIGGWGYGQRVYAALKFFLYTMFGSALMLVGILALAFVDRDTRVDQSSIAAQQLAQLDQTIQSQLGAGIQPDPELLDQVETLAAEVESADRLTFDLVELAENRGEILEAQQNGDLPTDPDANSWNPLHWDAAKWIFLALALAFAVKVPLVPLHTWLPDAHTQAPTAGSVILAGVMLKLGTYGFLRFGLYLFPDSSQFFAPVFLTLGVVGILYGAVVATMQKDLKRLVAYSSVAHLGFIALGTFALTTQGIEGGILQMVNHGISTGALFLLLGMIYERRHTYEIATMSGMQKTAPILAGVFTLVMLSSIGLPGLNGFVGEFLILAGAYLTAKWWAVVAAGGVILAALYLLWAYQRVFHGTPADDDPGTPEIKLGEFAVMVPLMGLIVFLGVYPKPVLERIEPAVSALVQHIEDTTDFTEPDAATSGFSGTIVDSHGEESDDSHDEEHDESGDESHDDSGDDHGEGE